MQLVMVTGQKIAPIAYSALSINCSSSQLSIVDKLPIYIRQSIWEHINITTSDNNQQILCCLLINLTFIGCGESSRPNPVLRLSQVNISIRKCIFVYSKGRVIDAINSTIAVKTCIFKNSSAGILTANYNTTMHDIGSVYVLNFSAVNATAILYIISSAASFTKCSFQKNGYNTTDIIHARDSIVVLNQCEITNSTVKRNILRANKNSTIDIYESKFQYSLKTNKVLFINESHLTINNSIFEHNGRVLYISNSRAESYKNLVISNNSGTKLFTVKIHKSIVNFENITISYNSGSIYCTDSKITFNATSHFFKNYRSIGTFITIASTIHFKGEIVFKNNVAWSRGGALRATESRVYTHANALFIANEAENMHGGALYLEQSNLICEQHYTFIDNRAPKGGAIYALKSIITIGNDWNKFKQKINSNSLLSFVANTAEYGGAVYLDANSNFRAPRGKGCKYVLEFDKNKAEIGGAIYVNDHTSTIACKNTSYGTCFVQAPSFTLNPWNGWIKINSVDGNTTIYGGLLDRCIAQNRYNNRPRLIGIDYMKRVTQNKNIENMITSEPVRVCFCRNKKVDCNYAHEPFNVKRGQMFKVSIAAVDQVNHTLDALIFIKPKQNYRYHLGTDQQVQKASKGCSDLTLNVFSPNDSIELIIYADGPCQHAGISQLSLYINFKNCTCPIGFQPLTMQNSDICSCDCDKQIETLTKTCNQSSESLLRQGDFWINYINNTGTIHYLTYPLCPYDYCVPSINATYINLNIPNGVDAQCAFNRTGLLCSSCKPGLSLSLGSSRCLLCPRDWPKLFIAIALGAIASGIALIVMILVLNLTTAVGTLNGLIFYANIMASNNITYNHMSKPNGFSVFIAWLNLELGIDTCFYNGLDSYSKAWLQFIFPAYLIAVLFFVILMSKYSSTFVKLIGKRNPIATLATIILLSYMKLLRNIKDIFSVAVLRYPDGLQKCWLPDANIEYLQGKHVPLFLLAVIIVFLGLSYTILLLTWQWLLQTPNYKCLGWIRNTRLNLFMEANLAAYSSKHRYWTGLLLLIRVVLYLEIALDTSNQTSNNLVATGLICTCLLFVKTLSGSNVYKKNLLTISTPFAM